MSHLIQKCGKNKAVGPSVQGDKHYLAEGESGFEDGTLDFLALPAVEIGLQHIDAIGMDTIHERVRCLTGWLLENLLALDYPADKLRIVVTSDASTDRTDEIALEFPGVTVQRVMTDNGTGYRSNAHRAEVARLEIRHVRTRPYRPRTNGKAERFIQTLQREWAYAAAYESSWQRRQALLPWLRYYNCTRPHSSLAKRTPISQLN